LLGHSIAKGANFVFIFHERNYARVRCFGIVTQSEKINFFGRSFAVRAEQTAPPVPGRRRVARNPIRKTGYSSTPNLKMLVSGRYVVAIATGLDAK
jgi:hypothetical protein